MKTQCVCLGVSLFVVLFMCLFVSLFLSFCLFFFAYVSLFKGKYTRFFAFFLVEQLPVGRYRNMRKTKIT